MSDTVVINTSSCPACGSMVLPDPNSAKGWICPQCDAAPTSASKVNKSSATRVSASQQFDAAAFKHPSQQSAVRVSKSSMQAADAAYLGNATVAVAPSDFSRESVNARSRVSSSAARNQAGFGGDARQWVGRVLNERYRLEEFLGQGAMGSVFRCVQLALNKSCTIKILHPSLSQDSVFRTRFFQEAQIAAAIKHPGIVEVFDFGQDQDAVYFVMEFLKGETLTERMRAQGRLEPSHAVWVAILVAEAVAVAHAQGVIHRDLKPDNIFIAQGDNGQEQIKVLDFGLSKTLGGNKVNITAAGVVCGTPSYMSPEQTIGRKLDGRSDQYSLGVVLYELLSGVVPFGGADSVVVMGMHINQPPPPIREVSLSSKLEAVLLRSLAKRPDDRFASMQEFARALRGTLDSLDGPARPASSSRIVARSSSDHGSDPAYGSARSSGKPAPSVRSVPSREPSPRGSGSRGLAANELASSKDSGHDDAPSHKPPRKPDSNSGKKRVSEIKENEGTAESNDTAGHASNQRTTMLVAIGGAVVVLVAAALLVVAVVVKKSNQTVTGNVQTVDAGATTADAGVDQQFGKKANQEQDGVIEQPLDPFFDRPANDGPFPQSKYLTGEIAKPKGKGK